MLKKVKRVRPAKAVGGHFAIVASRYNERYVEGMLRAATVCLKEAKVQSVKIVRVPGAFEIPVVAAKLARLRETQLDAIICLGVILRGETTHAQHIGEAVSQALVRIQMATGIPVIHEVLLLDTPRQAEARCLSRDHNRGAEAAQTALEMKRIMESI